MLVAFLQPFLLNMTWGVYFIVLTKFDARSNRGQSLLFFREVKQRAFLRKITSAHLVYTRLLAYCVFPNFAGTGLISYLSVTV